MFLSILTLIGALGMFLYGMNMMSSGLQKAAGDGLRRFVASMTSNPLKGVTTGLGVTAVIQSSSATTVMVVSFVNAGLLSLTNAIGVIMGANIGTTVTAWLISLLGFSADISLLAIPLIAVGFVFYMSKKSKRKSIGEFIIGFALLFMGLAALIGIPFHIWAYVVGNIPLYWVFTAFCAYIGLGLCFYQMLYLLMNLFVLYFLLLLLYLKFHLL